MSLNNHLEKIVDRYFNQEYLLYKPSDAKGEEIKQRFTFSSRNEFLRAYLDFYRNLESLEDAIQYACSSRFKLLYEGKIFELKHNHQDVRVNEKGKEVGVIDPTLMEMARNVLTKIAEISTCKTFEGVYDIIKSVKVKGFGELSIYDATVRITAFLGIIPENVYLHAGALVGARTLELQGALPAGSSEKGVVPLKDFPEPLRKVGALKVENLLCSFKNDLVSA